MINPQLGDSINGAEIGRSRGSTFYWVRCPDGSSPNCRGERWTTVGKRRYSEDNPDWNKVRLCWECYMAGPETFALSPRKLPTRAM